ncbi:MAG: HAD family hydrolase [Spirochaetes bacterium]|nr:HAD family hydrolase [Spirochaetota bacterium]
MVLLAFDMDGTIFDSGGIISSAWQKAAADFRSKYNIELKIPSTEEIMTQIGYPADVIYGKFFPELSFKQQMEMSELSVMYLCDDIAGGGGFIYDGIPEVLKNLNISGVRMVIASNGSLSYLKTILKSKNLEHYFEDEIITIDNAAILNKNDIIKKYIEKYPDCGRYIMIGDRLSDLNAARTNGIYFIGCAFGHAGDEEFKDEKYIAHSADDLLKSIMKITEGMI